VIDRDSITALVTASIRGNAGNRVTPIALQGCIDRALRQYAIDHKQEKIETLELVAGTAEYATTTPVLSLHWHDWHLPDSLITETYPTLFATIGDSFVRLTYPPTDTHIETIGASVRVMYLSYGASDPALIPDWHEDRIETLATAYVMLSLASMDILEPIQLHGGMGDKSTPRSAMEHFDSLSKLYAKMLAATGNSVSGTVGRERDENGRFA
jgi:hypothetical protein